MIHLMVRLVEPAQVVRLHENTHIQLQGVAIAHLDLPAGEVESACRSVEAWLFKPEWKNKLVDSAG